jgi:hypothetical protein
LKRSSEPGRSAVGACSTREARAMSRFPWPRIRGLPEALWWIGTLLVLWLPSCGGFAISCRPWRSTELYFGYLGYYRARYSHDGTYFEGFQPDSLFNTVAASVVVTLLCAWWYSRSGRG